MGINVLSLFDGMSCGQQALERSGIEVERTKDLRLGFQWQVSL
jgi:hypothetical protein